MKVGIVLSGGFAKGAYQIGVLKAVQSCFNFSDIGVMSAASIGALNAYSFLSGRLDEGERIWRELICGEKPVFIGHLMRSAALQSILDELCTGSPVLGGSLFVTYYDLSHAKLIYKDIAFVEGSMHAEYLRAAVTLPVVSRPVRIQGRSLYDGAPVDNIPVYPLLRLDADLLICVYFDNVSYLFENEDFDRRILKCIFPEENSLTRSVLVDRKDIDRMVTAGYDRARYLLDSVLAQGTEDKDGIYTAIERTNAERGKRSFRITGDVIATNLNRLAGHFSKRQIET